MTESRISNRLASIELLKAFGIIFLIFLHQTVWLYVYGDVGGLVFPQAYDVFKIFSDSGLHVLGFGLPLLAGVTFYLSFNKKYSSWGKLLQRVFGLLSLGFMMNLLAWGPTGLFDWDVLQFISLSMFLTYPILKYFPRKMSIGVVLILGILTLSQSDVFPWVSPRDSYFYQIIIGSREGINYWPICPWYAVFAAGIVTGWVFSLKNKPALIYLGIVGAILFTISIISNKFLLDYDVNRVWGVLMFKPSKFFVVGIIGSQMLGVSLLELFFLARPKFLNCCQNIIIKAFGQGILWIYTGTIITGYQLTIVIKQSFPFDFNESIFVLIILCSIGLLTGFFIGYFTVRKSNIRYVTIKDL